MVGESRSGQIQLKVFAAAALATLALCLAGCSTPTQSVGVEASDVATVELFIYSYGSDEPSVKRTVISDPEVVAELVKAYTDVPGGLVEDVPESAVGSEATDVRFTLEDGDVVDLTRVSLAPEDTINVWSDSAIQHTSWGVPFDGYYDDLGTTTTVDASELPSRAGS